MMLLRVCLAILLTCPVAGTAGESPLELLVRNRAIWDSLHITDYQYSIDHQGGGWTDPPVMHVVVRNSEVQSAHQDNPPLRLLECVFPEPNPELCKLPEDAEMSKRISQTIPQLFDSLISVVSAKQNDPSAQIVLDFDSRHGFPARVYLSPSPGESHTSGGFSITSFTVLE
jgi:hypothetical protein